MVVSRSKLDVICVCESHLIADEVLSIDGYIWFGNNRKQISPRARKGSGGVGILIREHLVQQFSLEVVDNEFEGILCLLFNGIQCDESFGVCVCYLPPANSSRGNTAVEFFDHLAGTVSSLHDVDKLCTCGDFNARCGSLSDYRPRQYWCLYYPL